MDRVFADETTLPDTIQPLLEDLKTIAKRKNLSVHDMLIDYLNDRDSYQPFVSQGQPITPRQVIEKALAIITNQDDSTGSYTDLELALSSIRSYDQKATSSKNKYNWKLPKAELYKALSVYYPEFAKQFSLENFRNLTSDELQALFTGPNGLFLGNPKLERAKILQVTQGTKSVVQPAEATSKIEGKLQKGYIKTIWESIREQAAAAGVELAEKYSAYEKLEPEAMAELFNQVHYQYVAEDGESHTVTAKVVSDKNGNKRVQYSYEYTVVNQPKVKESASYITLTFPYSTLGEIYHFGYSGTQSFFAPVTEGPVANGSYRGMYIYKATLPNQKTVYAISRSIISPNSYAQTFASLDEAIAGVDRAFANDKIGENGLVSIKQQTGIPRQVNLEMRNLKEGQIISVLDIALPFFSLNKLPGSFRQMMSLTVPDFQARLRNLSNIEKIDTPEKAAAFLIKATQLIPNRTTLDRLTGVDNLLDFIVQNQEGAEAIIEEIAAAPKKHYYIEKLVVTKEEGHRQKRQIATLRLLEDGGTSINLEGNRVGDTSVDEFINQAMDGAINFINQKYGIQVTSMTSSELEQFSRENNLGLESKVDSIKAFIYNGQIYINTSNAKTSDLYHEISHLFLGALKAQYPEGYQQIIAEYQAKSAYKRKFNWISRSYTNFAMQDKVEEAVVDMIADELFRDGALSIGGFNQARFTEMMQSIINTVDSFKKDMTDSGLGFNDFMKTLISSTAGKQQKQRILTNFVQQMIANKQISEVNC